MKQLIGLLCKTNARAKCFFHKAGLISRYSKQRYRQFQQLGHECLEPRRLLAPLYWDGASNVSWTSANWSQNSNGGLPHVSWSPNSDAVIQGVSGGSGANIIITIPNGSTVTPNSITFLDNYTYDISGGTVALAGNTTIDVEQNTSAEIDSNISGSSYALIKQDDGTLVLGGMGNVTVGAMTDIDGGTLIIHNNTSITNGDNSDVGLLVSDSATVQDTGTVSLATGTSLDYTSGGTSIFSGSITGAGGLLANLTSGGELTLDGGSGGNNTYTGGTDIESGNLQLANGATLGADTNALIVGQSGNLNLNGCSVTVGALTDGSGGGGTIDDSVVGYNPDFGTIARLTVAVPIAANPDSFSGSIEGAVRVVVTGPGTLVLANGNNYTGGTEIDNGTLQLGATSALPLEPLTVNTPGVLNINDLGNSVGDCTLSVTSLNGNGTITDGSRAGGTTTLQIGNWDTSTAGVFAGVIEDGPPAASRQKLALLYNGSGPLALTGDNYDTYSGGTIIQSGTLQIGDGQANGQISGVIMDGMPGGLVFDVTGTSPQVFHGAILAYNSTADEYGGGSVEKTGDGTLTFTNTIGGADLGSYSYPGALRVEGGELTLDDQDDESVLPYGASVTVENGATLNLDGNDFEVSTVALNGDSKIVSTDSSGNDAPATLTATGSFDFASGTVCASVKLAGSASLNKRTTGTVTLEWTNTGGGYTGGTFVDDGQLIGIFPAGAAPTLLEWRPGNAANTTWDNGNDYWFNETTGSMQAWPNDDATNNYVAVFNTDYAAIAGVNTITITATVEPREIEFVTGATNTGASFDIEDDGQYNSEILVPGNESLDVSVPDNASETLGSIITGGGSLTKEDGGQLLLVGHDLSQNVSTYSGGNYIDAGIVQARSSTALGLGGLTVDETGVFDLNGNAITVTSLNSAGLQSGTITDNSTAVWGAPATALTVNLLGNSEAQGDYNGIDYSPDTATNPGVFGGAIEDGIGHKKVSLNLDDLLEGRGLLLTLTGQNTYSGGTFLGGELQLGDGANNGSITGVTSLFYANANFSPQTYGGVVFDVSAGTSQTFTGSLLRMNGNQGTGYVVKTGAGTLVLNSDENFGGNIFGSAVAEDGVLQLGDDGALPQGTYLTIYGDVPSGGAPYGATLDLGDHKTFELANVTLVGDGSILQDAQDPAKSVGTAQSYGELVSNSFTFDNFANGDAVTAIVTANLAGLGGLQQGGAGLTSLSGYNTYSGGTLVSGGELEVDGKTGGPITVGQNATLAGAGTCPGLVTIMSGGFLSLGGETGPATFTLGGLTLDAGSSVQDSLGGEDTYLADITGPLTIDPTVVFTTVATSAPTTVPYQVVFQYGSLSSGGFGNLSAAGLSLLSNVNASSIDLTNVGTTTLRYWDGTASDTWNGTADDWLNSAVAAASWQTGDIAIFENLGTYAVSLASGFTAQPAAIFFLGGQFNVSAAGNGELYLPTNDSMSITVAAGVSATISVPVSSATNDVDPLVAILPGSTLALTNAGNNYSGGTTIVGGTLAVSSASCLGSASGPITLDGGTIEAAATLALQSPISLAQNGGIVETGGNSVSVELTGQINGPGWLTVAGSGTLEMDLSGPTAYAGTDLENGTLQLMGPVALGGLIVNGGTLDLNGNSTTVTSLSGSGGIVANKHSESACTLTVDQSLVTEYYGAIQDAGGVVGLIVSGPGTLALWGVNAYSDGTTISAGTLEVDGLVAGTVTVDQGATLSGAGTCSGTVYLDPGTVSGTPPVVTAGGILLLGSATAPATLTVGTLTLSAGSVVMDYVGDDDAYLAKTGSLNIESVIEDGVTLSVTFDTIFCSANPVPYQVIFQYGSLSSGGFGNLAPPANDQLVDNSTGPSIDLTNAPLLVWAGGNGTWTASGTNWKTPAGLSTAWQNGDIAVFSGGSGVTTVVLDDDFEPAGIVFAGIAADYLLTTNNNQGGFSFNGSQLNSLSIIDEAHSATISCPFTFSGVLSVAVASENLLVLSGNDGGIGGGSSPISSLTVPGNIVLSTGELQLGDGNPDGATSESMPASNVVFPSGTAMPTLAFDAPGGYAWYPGGTDNGVKSTYSGNISGAGMVLAEDVNTSQSGPAAEPNDIQLCGTNTYILGTTIDADATLELGNGQDSTKNATLASNVIDNGALAFNIAIATVPYVFSPAISGSGSVRQEGSGTVLLSADNSYGGGTTIFGGTLSLVTGAQISGNVTVGTGGVIEVDAGSAIQGTLTVSQGNATWLGDGTVEGAVSVTGSAELFLGQGSQAATLNAPSGVDVTGSAQFTMANATSTLAGSLFYDSSASSDTLAGNIVDGTSSQSTLTVDSGDLILTGVNTYTGGTFVEGGVLQAAGLYSLPGGGGLKIGNSPLGAPITFGPFYNAGPLAITTIQPAGEFDVGDAIDIQVNFGEPITVTGVPELELNTGNGIGYAQYIPGRVTSAMLFQYFVQPGDDTSALDYASATAIVLNGGSIVNSAGNPISLALPSPGEARSISGGASVVLDTAPPVVSSINWVGQPTTDADNVQFAVTFSKPVLNVAAADFVLVANNVTGDIESVSGSGADYVVTVNDLSGTGTLGLNLVSNSPIVDYNGNPISGGFTGETYNVLASIPWTVDGESLSGQEPDAVSGTVATFTDTRGYSAGQYTAVVNWGDGAQSSGTVTYDGGSNFEIDGSHTYARAGYYQTEVFISDPNMLMAVADGTADVADATLTAGALTLPSATAGFATPVAELFHFTDADPSAVVGQFYATVTWGDEGSSTITSTTDLDSIGQIVADPAGGFDVDATHAYLYGGGMTTSVTVSDVGGSTCSAGGSITITDPGLVAGTLTPPPLGTTSFSHRALFTFTDNNPLAPVTDFTSVKIYWGDGTVLSSDGAVRIRASTVSGRTVYTVYGFHTYTGAFEGATFEVLVTDHAGSTLEASDTDFAVEDTPPAVTSIDCASNQLEPGATSLEFNVTFSEAVTGLTASDFALSGGGSSGTITSLAGSGANYVVTVSGVSGNGTLGLNLAYSTGIKDTFGTPMGGFDAGNQTFTGQQYALSTEFYWSGGSGQWGGDNWKVGSSSGPLLTWVNGAQANFADNTGTVTLSTPTTAGSLSFSTGTIDMDGYNLTVASCDDDQGTGLITNSNTTTAMPTFTIDGAVGSQNFAGSIAGNLAFVAAGGEIDACINELDPSGGTTIDSGASLFIGIAGSSGSLGGNVVDNGNLWFASAGAVTVTGNISGSGNILVDWPDETVVLAGDNSYSGQTVIDQGTLQMGSATALGGGANLVINGGTLDLNGHDVTVASCDDNQGTGLITNSNTTVAMPTFTIDGAGGSQNFSGSIAGNLAFVAAGGEIDACINELDPSGGTTIDPGVNLFIGIAGSSGSLGGNVVDNGNLWFVSAGAVTVSGNISGSGNVVLDWQGEMVVLAGNNTYTGDTTIYGGTLAIDSGGSIDVSGGSTMTIDAGSSFINYGTATNEGTISVEAGAVMVNTDTGNLTSTGEIEDAGTIVNASGAMLDLGGGGIEVNGDGVVTCDGTSTIENGENISFNGTSGAVITGPDTLTDDSGNLILVNGDSYTMTENTPISTTTYPNVFVTGGSTLDLDGYNLLAGTLLVDTGNVVDSAGAGSAIANSVIMNNATASGSGTSITGANLILTNSTINCEVFGGNSSVDGTTTLIDTTGSTIISNVTVSSTGSLTTGVGTGSTITINNLTNYGAVTVAYFDSLDVTGNLENHGTLVIDGIVDASFYNGTCNVGGNLDNYGTASIDGGLNVAGNINNPGTLHLGGEAVVGGNVTNSGLFFVGYDYGGDLTISGNMTNSGTMYIGGNSYMYWAFGSIVTVSGNLSNTGTINVGENCEGWLNVDAALDNSGTINVGGGYGDGNLAAYGTLNELAGDIAVAANGTYTDTAGSTNYGAITNSGSFTTAACGNASGATITNDGTFYDGGSTNDGLITNDSYFTELGTITNNSDGHFENHGTLDVSATDAVFANYGTLNDYQSQGSSILGSISGNAPNEC